MSKNYRRMPPPDDICLGTKVHHAKRRFEAEPDDIEVDRCNVCQTYSEIVELEENNGVCDLCFRKMASLFCEDSP